MVEMKCALEPILNRSAVEFFEPMERMVSHAQHEVRQVISFPS